MCRGGLTTWVLASAAIALVACVDADNAPPGTGIAMGPTLGAGISGGPKAGSTGGATTPPPVVSGGIAGMTPPPPVSTGGIQGLPPVAGSGPVVGTAGGGAAGGGATAGGGAPKAGAGGGGAAGGGAAGGGGTATGAKFSEVFPILMMKCAGCHGALGGIMFTNKDMAYTTLTTSMGTGMCSTLKKVEAGKPDMSELVHILKGDGCRMGKPMPPAGAPVSADDQAKIASWIMAGAKND